MFFQALPVGALAIFKQRLLHRLKELAEEAGQERFVMPVGLILVIDEQNGGDTTAKELVARFGLLDFESLDLIDFYFLGWHRTEKGAPASIAFDLSAFHDFRTALQKKGITKFGGNADLILVDAHYAPGDIRLNFEEAIRIDLSVSSEEKDFTTLGGFLQSLIEAAREVRHDEGLKEDASLVFTISDKLGLAIAKQSLLTVFLEKFGKVIGAKKMATLAVRNLGPSVSLKEL